MVSIENHWLKFDLNWDHLKFSDKIRKQVQRAFSHMSKEDKVKGALCHQSSEDQPICSFVWFGMLLYQLRKELLDL